MAHWNPTRLVTFAAGLLAGAGGLYLSICARMIPMVQAGAANPPRAASAPAPQPEVEILVADEDLLALLRRQLILPVEGFDPGLLSDTFSTPRPGHKTHEAIDIPARRGTPVLAADDGVIVRLAASARGGISIYQFDPGGKYCYFYAHLDRYANHLREGSRVERGDVIGYVGSTGDARESGPHLHFAITRVISGSRWAEGAPIDPYPVFAGLTRKDSGRDEIDSGN